MSSIPGHNDVPKPDKASPAETPYLDLFERIVDRSHTEVERVNRWYWRLLSALGIVAAAGTYVSYSSLKDFREETRTEVVSLKAEVAAQTKKIADDLEASVKRMNAASDVAIKQIADNVDGTIASQSKTMEANYAAANRRLERQVEEMARSVNLRVEEKLKDENVASLIRMSVTERIPQVADALIKDGIETRLNPRIGEAQSRLAELNVELKKANIARDSLELQAGFIMTVLKAQADDRVAFDQLRRWGGDASYKFTKEALSAWDSIVDSYDADSLFKGEYSITWREGVDPLKLSIGQLAENLPGVNAGNRVALIQYIQKREDIPIFEKMELYYKIVKSDSSLNVVGFATRYMNVEAKINRKYLLIDFYTKWWEAQRESYRSDKEKKTATR